MPSIRRYDDPCGIARALDVVGERWALLVARELIFGPKRFGQLRDGLHGVSPNVLSQRLRDLEEAGIVRRGVLDPPASVAIYELTARGRSERPAVTFDTDVETLRSVTFGREPISEAERDGRLTVDGDRLLAERFARMFLFASTSCA